MKRFLTFIAVLIVVVVIVFFVITPQGGDSDILNDSIDQAAPPALSEISSIVVQKEFNNGVHKISGIITLPDPCYEIESEVVVMESFPEQVRITLTTPRKEGFCAQVLTDKAFEVTFQASDQAKISAFLNDVKVELVES